MIYFTSDTHFYHKNVIPYCNRPFYSVEEMNETLISNWNAVVNDDDTVFHLGDFGFCTSEQLSNLCSRLSGGLVLIRGNHDTRSVKKYISCGFDEVHDNLDYEEFHLCHYPNEILEVPFDKFKHVKPTVTDKWIISGHVHDRWKIKNRCFNVGVDVNGFAPISIEKIREEIKEYEYMGKV